MRNTTHSGEQFFWCGQVGISEASTLGFTPECYPPETITVRSQRTGRDFLFRHVRTVDRSEDSFFYMYVSQETPTITLHVYED